MCIESARWRALKSIYDIHTSDVTSTFAVVWSGIPTERQRPTSNDGYCIAILFSACRTGPICSSPLATICFGILYLQSINLNDNKMSSGVGVTGTLGRCYPFFADLKKCVVSFVWQRWLFSRGWKWCGVMWYIAQRLEVYSTIYYYRLCDFRLELAVIDWSIASSSPPFHSITIALFRSRGKQRTVLRRCAGVKTKIILNASTDSKKKHTNSRLPRKSNDEKALEQNLTFIPTQRKMTFTPRAWMLQKSVWKRQLRNKWITNGSYY